MEFTHSRKAVDNAGLRFRDRSEGTGDRKLLQDYRLFRSEDLLIGFKEIVQATSQFASLLTISGRLKRTDTLIRKLRRENSMKLSFMDDIVGFRLVVRSRLIQAQIIEALTQALRVKIVRDYIKSPAQSGYRGVHVICHVPKLFPGNTEASNLTYEIQIRTEFQHFWSTTSESMGEQVKEGGGTKSQREELASISEKINAFECANPSFEQSSSSNPVLSELNIDHADARVDREYAVSPYNSPINFWIINFDKKKGRTVRTFSFGSDLQRAILHYQYSEDEFSRNFNHEIVLLASAEEPNLRNSHSRYYHLNGRPQMPYQLKANQQC